MVTDKELMARFYTDKGSKLSSGDRFLRDYILNEGWKDRGQMAMPDDFIDKEDDDREDEMDNFE